MPNNYPNTSNIDTGLPITPEQVKDPGVFNELSLIYRAIKSLASAIYNRDVGSPTFSAYASAATNLVQNVYTKIGFQTTEWNVTGAYDTGLSRFTPKVAGYYQVNACVTMATSFAGGNSVIYKTGVVYKYGVSINPTSADTAIFPVNSLVHLNGSTDYIEIYCMQTAATQNTANGAIYTYFNAALVLKA